MLLSELPIEIIYIITSYLKYTRDYCNLRITCKSLYYTIHTLKYYFFSGPLRQKITFLNHLPFGDYKEYYLCGSEKLKVPFIDGKIYGTVEMYNYEMEKIYYCYYKNNKKLGMEEIYYKNNVLAQLTPFTQIGIHGEKKIFHINGYLKANIDYSNNELDGNCIYYYDNNITKYVLNFKKNKLNGPCLGFYNNGKLRFIMNYYYNICYNSAKYFYVNGKISANYFFKVGVLDGYQYEYYNNGKIKRIFNVNRGKLSGKLKLWNMDGTPYIICEFKEGNFVNKAYLYKNNRKYVLTINSISEKGYFFGLVKIFHNSKLIIDTEIKKNRICGIIKDYRHNFLADNKYGLRFIYKNIFTTIKNYKNSYDKDKKRIKYNMEGINYISYI